MSVDAELTEKEIIDRLEVLIKRRFPHSRLQSPDYRRLRPNAEFPWETMCSPQWKAFGATNLWEFRGRIYAWIHIKTHRGHFNPRGIKSLENIKFKEQQSTDMSQCSRCGNLESPHCCTRLSHSTELY